MTKEEAATYFDPKSPEYEVVRIISIEFALECISNLPTGMFDSTPYKQKQIASLEKELVKARKDA